MNLSLFKISLSEDEPPESLSVYLNALWYDAKGCWDKAHQVIQDVEDNNAAWIHGYLHRKEGDQANAAYWYKSAGRKMPVISLEKEWDELVAAFI